MLKKFAVLLFIVTTLYPQFVSAKIKIVEVRLARDVVDREPVGEFQPLAYCENAENQETRVPIIDSMHDRKVFLWNKVTSLSVETLRHTWYKDGMECQIKATHYDAWDKVLSKLKEVGISLGWKRLATINLKLSQSPGFRTWSSKEIDPHVHKGKWKVVVSTASDPSNILCIAKFEIK